MNYDQQLWTNAESTCGCDGEPQVINKEIEFEGYDDEGFPETSVTITYSCEECDNYECEHWKEHHSEKEWQQVQQDLNNEQ